MNRNQSVYRLAVAALLCAVGIMIPMVMPIKVYIPPMSFTLASHVAIFLAIPYWKGKYFRAAVKPAAESADVKDGGELHA